MFEGTLDEDDKVAGEYAYLRNSSDCTVPFGFDPVWNLSKSQLSFTNNVKMKISVIFGVVHMTIGIVCKGTNAVYFRQWDVLSTEVITGLVILLGLFGWMDFLIYAKWFKELDIEDRTIRNQAELDDALGQDNTDTGVRPEY